MALVVDQQSNFKHYCKICKKGFGCGRALGGHMRAHGIGDESDRIDYDDDDDDDNDDHDHDDHELGGNNNNNNVPPSNKCMYALRANPNRLKSCRVCENCGKEFLCWKSFLEHGKCSSYEEAESLVSSPGSDGEYGTTPRRGCGWSKRKRSLRAQVAGGDFNPNCPSSEEEDLANCLMMLSNATVLDPLDAEPEESCASASKEEGRIRNTMNFISPIACKSVPMDQKAKGVANNKGLFECKACKKVFNSHQALGGHRASHKKVKGCFAARLDHMDDSLLADDQDHDVITHEEFFLPTKSTSTMQIDHHGTNNYNTSLASSSKRKSKVHECSICHRVFSSGQALGGHKRCHWITSNSPAETTSLAKLQQYHHDHVEQIQQRPKLIDNSDPLDLKLDLNLPAPNEHVSMEVSTDIYLQPWIGVNDDGNKEKDIDNQHNQEIESDQTICNTTSLQNNNVDDEANNKVKLAKLSELKDMNISGGSSPWLQVGIGSATDVEDDQ